MSQDFNPLKALEFFRAGSRRVLSRFFVLCASAMRLKHINGINIDRPSQLTAQAVLIGYRGKQLESSMQVSALVCTQY